MLKPAFARLWQAFPDHNRYPNMEALYTWLGGTAKRNIHVDGFGVNGNTCASRMSVAFNHGGAPIVAGRLPPRKTIGAADGTRIIWEVAMFRRYLLATLGAPSVDNASPFNDSFRGKRGIIAFSVNWKDATGHIALWNSATFREPDHDNYATYVNPVDSSRRTYRGEFWELP